MRGFSSCSQKSPPARVGTSDLQLRGFDEHPAPLERAAERGLIRILEVSADGQAGCGARHADPEISQHAAQVRRGGLALGVGIRGEDDLLHLSVGKALEQFAGAQVTRAAASMGEMEPPSTW